MLAAAALVCAGCSRSQEAKAGDGDTAVDVHLYPVEEKLLRRDVPAVGSLHALEQSTVSAEVEGRVERILADVGDTVRQGQVLVTLSPVELEYEVARQRAAVQQVRARLGMDEDDPLPQDPSQVAFVQRAAADLFEAQQRYTRAQQLHGDQLISQQQLDEAAARFQSARAAHQVALQEVEQLKAQLRSSEAALQLAQKKLTDATIRAPFPGAITERLVSPGEFLRVQSPVAVIVRTDSLRARLAVPERWAGAVSTGAEVLLRVEAWPGEVFRGRLNSINPVVAAETRTFEVEALVRNGEGRLKPGFFVEATIPTSVEEKSLVIPRPAIFYRYGVYKVFVPEGEQVNEREIKVGAQREDEVEILEGLRAGEKVAVPVQGELAHGARVRVVPNDSTRPAGGVR